MAFDGIRLAAGRWSLSGPDIRVVVHLTTIPINLLLIAWIAVGRIVLLPVDVAAAGTLPLTVAIVAPVLAVLLMITTTIAIRQHRPADGYLTAAQLGALTGCWLALTGFGFFLVDAGPGGAGAASPFTQLLGAPLTSLSDALTLACLYGFVAAYITLLILLIRGLDGANERRRAGQLVGAGGGLHPAPPHTVRSIPIRSTVRRRLPSGGPAHRAGHSLSRPRRPGLPLHRRRPRPRRARLARI